MSASVSLHEPDWVSPPGHTVVSILEERELSIEDFAKAIRQTVAVAQGIVDGSEAIDRALAQSLANALGASEHFWISREQDYRASITPRDDGGLATIDDLLESLPFRDMQKFGWVPHSRSREEKIAESLSFFGVSSLAQWRGRYDDAFSAASYRISSAHVACPVSTAAWLRQGEIETLHDHVEVWSAEKLKSSISQIKRLTWIKKPSVFIPKIRHLLADSGVKFAIVRSPKGCTASGAVRVLEESTPHVQLSFRYLSDDQFWFTLLHEIAHLILHFDRMPIIETDDQSESAIEQEANEFASNVIVPAEHYEEFLTLGSSRFPIIDFAKKVGVAPGLIVGQLQHHQILGYNQMQHLKRRYQWEV